MINIKRAVFHIRLMFILITFKFSVFVKKSDFREKRGFEDMINNHD